MNKVILTADCDLKDNDLREWVSKIQRQMESINDRTKKHTLEIQELRKEKKQ